jgi:hypothetical protein
MVLSLRVSGLLLLVLLLDVFVQQQPKLCQEVYGLQHLVQEPVLHLDLPFYRSQCDSHDVSAYKSLLLYLDELCAVPGLACFQKLCAAPRCVCL